MAKTKFDIKTEATKPLLAGVGVTDLAVEVVRDLVAETQTRLAGVQKDVTARVADVQRTAADPQALRLQAVTVVNARVDALAKEAKARRQAIEARVAELQAEAMAYPAAAADAYTDLVKRGESLVGRIRRQESTKATVTSARTTSSKAKTTTTQAKKATATTKTTAKTAAKKATSTARTTTKPAAKKAATATSSAKATVTAAKKTATNAADAVADGAEKVGD